MPSKVQPWTQYGLTILPLLASCALVLTGIAIQQALPRGLGLPPLSTRIQIFPRTYLLLDFAIKQRVDNIYYIARPSGNGICRPSIPPPQADPGHPSLDAKHTMARLNGSRDDSRDSQHGMAFGFWRDNLRVWEEIAHKRHSISLVINEEKDHSLAVTYRYLARAALELLSNTFKPANLTAVVRAGGYAGYGIVRLDSCSCNRDGRYPQPGAHSLSLRAFTTQCYPSAYIISLRGAKQLLSVMGGLTDELAMERALADSVVNGYVRGYSLHAAESSGPRCSRRWDTPSDGAWGMLTFCPATSAHQIEKWRTGWPGYIPSLNEVLGVGL